MGLLLRLVGRRRSAGTDSAHARLLLECLGQRLRKAVSRGLALSRFRASTRSRRPQMGWTPKPWGLFKLFLFYSAWVLAPGLPFLAVALAFIRRDFRLLLLLLAHAAYRQVRAIRCQSRLAQC